MRSRCRSGRADHSSRGGAVSGPAAASVRTGDVPIAEQTGKRRPATGWGNEDREQDRRRVEDGNKRASGSRSRYAATSAESLASAPVER